ncbi:hypothetical protein [Serratia ureilytica]|uniref:hypothetical protein n=1 Tax=Serratia ureilytica TaxID=300181 RepID=UPI0025775133|nr:hypothetical protein [Serratia ureilytica]MDM1841082.1 hypothetical protein [Serratia ureilytica]
MTLTTERQQFEEWFKDSYHLAERELMANREVQPVLYASEETLAYAKEGEKSLVTWSEPMGDALIPLFTAPTAPAYPERLPCPVHLLPGLKFGKGVPTRSMLDALVRRAEYESERDAMTPEQKAEDDARIEAFKELLPRQPAPAVPDDFDSIIKRFQHQCDHLSDWHHIDEHSCKVDRRDLMTVTEFLNACRAAMLAVVPEGGNDHDTRR